MKRTDQEVSFMFCTFVVVSHRVFMKKQPFIDFLCEVMLHSPCGKRHYRREQNLRKADLRDVLKFLDRNSNRYYDGEIEFLLEHCKSKQLIFFSMKTNYFI